MAEMQILSESQEFGRWGQPIPAQEFGKGWPQVMPQDFGRWGQVVPPQDFGRWGRAVPAQQFGRGWPQAMPQQFGGRVPLIDQGWRSPWREIPPSGSRQLLH